MKTSQVPLVPFPVAGFSLVVAALVACGNSPMTVSEFCDEKAARECAEVAANCQAPPAACKAARVAACADFVQAQEPVATRPFRPDRASDCLNATTAAYKESPITPSVRQTMDDVCARAFSGMAKTGAPCTSTFECDGTLICDDARHVCAAKVVVASAGFCNNPGEVCPSGEQCLLGAGVPPTRQCRPPSTPAGQACDDVTNPCASNLRCVGGTCVSKVAAGDSCSRDADCENAAPYCDPYFNRTCDTGFIPSRGTPECQAFGVTM